jgi:hypothetical protein
MEREIRCARCGTPALIIPVFGEYPQRVFELLDNKAHCGQCRWMRWVLGALHPFGERPL